MQVANKAHGRIDRKEFRATVGTLVPAAPVGEINAYFDTFDIDAGGTLDNEELRACLVALQEAAAVAKKQESVLSARAALLRLAARITQEDVHKAVSEDKAAAAAEAAAEREAAEKEQAYTAPPRRWPRCDRTPARRGFEAAGAALDVFNSLPLGENPCEGNGVPLEGQ